MIESNPHMQVIDPFMIYDGGDIVGIVLEKSTNDKFFFMWTDDTEEYFEYLLIQVDDKQAEEAKFLRGWRAFMLDAINREGVSIFLYREFFKANHTGGLRILKSLKPSEVTEELLPLQ